MPKMIATERMPIFGTPVEVGEEFEVEDREANILVLASKAIYATKVALTGEEKRGPGRPKKGMLLTTKGD